MLWHTILNIVRFFAACVICPTTCLRYSSCWTPSSGTSNNPTESCVRLKLSTAAKKWAVKFKLKVNQLIKKCLRPLLVTSVERPPNREPAEETTLQPQTQQEPISAPV